MAEAAQAEVLVPPQQRTMQLPALLYGTAWKGARTASLVACAIQAGFRGIDTAAQPRHYDERGVGQGLADGMRAAHLTRNDIWIQTKFTSWDGQHASDPVVAQQGGVPYDSQAAPATQVRQSAAQSLLNLCARLPGATSYNPSVKGKAREDESAATSEDPLANLPQDWYLDALVLHSPLRTLPDTAAAWKAMEDLVLEGRVRQLGVSNVHDPRIWALLRNPSISPRIRPSILQNRWHASTGHDVSILPTLSPKLSPNDFPQATRTYSPESNEEDEPPPHDAQGVTYQPFWLLTGNPRLLESTPVLAAAAERGMTPEQVLYRFAAQGFGLPGLKVTVLSGTTDPTHVAQVVDAVTGPPAPLEGTSISESSELSRHAHLDLDEDTLDAIRREVYGL